MPYSIRYVQNKAKRESNEHKAAEFHESRSENQKLRKENARLRRELEKRNYIEPEDSINTLAEVEFKVKKKSVGCPDCGSADLVSIKAGPKTITVCKSCKWRKAD